MIGIDPAQVPLDRKIFNNHLDNLLTTGKLNPEILEHCDSYQMHALNEVKKSLVRLENKQ